MASPLARPTTKLMQMEMQRNIVWKALSENEIAQTVNLLTLIIELAMSHQPSAIYPAPGYRVNPRFVKNVPHRAIL